MNTSSELLPAKEPEDLLHVPMAALDADGFIVQTNEAWRRYGLQDSLVDLSAFDVGANFLTLCREPDTRWRAAVADGVAEVLRGGRPGFRHEYLARTLSQRRRFALIVVPRHKSIGGAFVFHFEITDAVDLDEKSSLTDWLFERCLSDILVFDGDSLAFIQVSDGARRNLGYTRSEFQSMTPMDIEPGIHESSLRERLHPLAAQRVEKIDYQTVFQRKNGSRYPVRVHAQCFCIDDRHIYFMIAEDCSRGSATENFLSEARAIMESTPDAMVVVDESGIVKAANSRMASFFGYRLDEIHGMPVEKLLPPRLRGQHVSDRKAFSADPRQRAFSAHMGLVARTKDGRELPVEISLSPVAAQDGVLIAAAIRDPKDAQGSAQLLEQSDARYRHLFDTATDIIHVVSPDGTFSYVNAAWQKALGYSASEAARMTVFDLVHPDEQREAQDNFARVMEGCSIERVRRRLISRAGVVKVFEGGATCQMRNGEAVAACSIMHDVTDRDEMEKELKAAKETAEKSTAAKSRFLAAASHDLRQPLQSLGLYLAVLRRRVDEPAVADIGNKMQTSVDAMSSLLDALLDISRFEAGVIAPQIAPFELQTLFNTIVTDSAQQAHNKGLALVCEKVNVRVLTDQALLARIVENFVTNAIRYTSSGSVEIKTRQASGKVTISVQDTGIGIPLDAVDKIFEEYYQVENSTRDRKKGLGLGLSIVRYIATLLELPLSVESTPDVGSTFSVTVPLVPLSAGSTPKTGTAASLDQIGVGVQDILLVDDDESLIDATSTLLETVGLVVHTAVSAEAAIELVRDGLRPALLLTDFRLPGASGGELVGQIRSLLAVPIPAVIMTGDTTIGEWSSSPLSDCEVMHKPVDTEHLLRVIATKLNGDAAS